MSRLIHTEDITPGSLSAEDSYHAYNGLDCCLTLEVFGAMPFEPYAEPAYRFERAMQGPVLEMQLRGMPVDMATRQIMQLDCLTKLERLRWIADQYTVAMGGTSVFGPKSISSKKLVEFLYDHCRLPPQFEIDKRTRLRKRSGNRDALEKLANYSWANPLCRVLMQFRDLDKEKDFLFARVDSDSRLRTSYNIAGTDTWRFSSSENAFGTGTNLQNVDPLLRGVVAAPPGKKFANIDLEQAESRLVAWLAFLVTGKTNYLDACESSDLHTAVARMVWPNLGWAGDPARDKPIARQVLHRGFTYRDLAKRGGHATNYLTTPPTMSKHLHIPKDVATVFQANYFRAFPEIELWHQDTARRLQVDGFLDTPFGFRRYFLGRRFDDTTLRAAIAHVPQSTISTVAKIGLYRVWKEMPEVEILHENHDNIIFMYPEAIEDQVVPKAINLMKIPFTHNNRTMIVPPAAKVGWLWAEAEDLEGVGRPHPDAMVGYKGHDKRKRQGTAKSN